LTPPCCSPLVPLTSDCTGCYLRCVSGVAEQQTGGVEAVLSGHGGDVLSVAWSPSFGTLASASADGTVRVWKTREHTVPHLHLVPPYTCTGNVLLVPHRTTAPLTCCACAGVVRLRRCACWRVTGIACVPLHGTAAETSSPPAPATVPSGCGQCPRGNC